MVSQPTVTVLLELPEWLHCYLLNFSKQAELEIDDLLVLMLSSTPTEALIAITKWTREGGEIGGDLTDEWRDIDG